MRWFCRQFRNIRRWLHRWFRNSLDLKTKHGFHPKTGISPMVVINPVHAIPTVLYGKILMPLSSLFSTLLTLDSSSFFTMLTLDSSSFFAVLTLVSSLFFTMPTLVSNLSISRLLHSFFFPILNLNHKCSQSFFKF